MPNFNDFKKKIAGELNKSLPHGIVELPSNGKKASIRSMKVGDQKDFLKAMEKKDEYLINECFDKILSNCVDTVGDEQFDNDKLCIQDRTFLLIKIREQTTGPVAKIGHIDPKTEELVPVEVDISKFPVKKYEGKNITREMQLTENAKIILGPITRKIEKDIEKWYKAQGSAASQVDKRYCAYAGIIHSAFLKNDAGEYEEIAGMSLANKIEFIVTFTTQPQLDIFDEYISTLDFGIKAKFNFVAPSGYENPEEEVNIISFFML